MGQYRPLYSFSFFPGNILDVSSIQTQIVREEGKDDDPRPPRQPGTIAWLDCFQSHRIARVNNSIITYEENFQFKSMLCSFYHFYWLLQRV